MLQPPTGTVTFLFTDIEGSTQLWERQPDAMRPALARHDELLRRAIAGHGGFLFKTVGDAFCAAFATAPEALNAALAAQISLIAEPWPTTSPLHARMALHTGAADERDGDYFGQPLNRVARLLAAGHGGQTLLSLATQELVRDTLPSLVSLRDLGDRRLKDLARPEQVFQLLHPLLTADFPPLRSLDNPDLPNNLPQQASSFIGREKEMDEVKALLGKTRLLTVTGAGGSGKTRLALQAAADLLTGGADGVWLVELAALSDPALVPQAVAQTLSVREEPGKTIGKTLVEWLRPKRLLLVLDNCEHLVASVAALAAELLRSCPGVQVLASSREPLNVAGEQTYRIPSLSLPDPKKTQTVESLSQFEAVRLFLERAKAVQPAFAVTNANAPAVAQVCFHLDGIPLAIELAAARVRSLTVEEINVRLDQRFRLLTGGARDTLPRQQTLRALIDWSYDLLTESEKTLLRRLSVFAGGWTLAAAEAICSGERVPTPGPSPQVERGIREGPEEGAAGAGAAPALSLLPPLSTQWGGAAGGDSFLEDWEVVDLLTSLVDKSLVVYEDERSGAGRSRLLETVRQYARDRLTESGEAEAVQGRAASWFNALAEEAEGQLRGPEGASWLSRLETEHDNLRAALSYFEQQPDGAADFLRLAGALGWFWFLRGHYADGRQWLGRALERNLRPGPLPVEEGESERKDPGGRPSESGTSPAPSSRALPPPSRLSKGDRGAGARAKALNGAGNLAWSQGDYAGARTWHEQCLALRREIGDQRGVAGSLGNLGLVAYEQCDYEAARALHEECLAIFRQLGEPRGIAGSLGNLGLVAYDQGDYAAARALHEEGLAIFRQLGDQSGVSISLDSLGNVAYDRGDFAAARALYAESLTIQRQLGDQGGIASSLEGLAGVAQRQDQPARAARLGGAAAALRESIGSPLPPVYQERADQTMDAVRAALGHAPFAAAWDAGRAMTPEGAVELALEGTPHPAAIPPTTPART